MTSRLTLALGFVLLFGCSNKSASSSDAGDAGGDGAVTDAAAGSDDAVKSVSDVSMDVVVSSKADAGSEAGSEAGGDAGPDRIVVAVCGKHIGEEDSVNSPWFGEWWKGPGFVPCCPPGEDCKKTVKAGFDYCDCATSPPHHSYTKCYVYEQHPDAAASEPPITQCLTEENTSR